MQEASRRGIDIVRRRKQGVRETHGTHPENQVHSPGHLAFQLRRADAEADHLSVPLLYQYLILVAYFQHVLTATL